jgi:hypothetical protein
MRYIITSILFLLAYNLNAQVYMKGVLNSPFDTFNSGDTLELSGIYEDVSSGKLFYYQRGTESKIPAEKISLQLDNVDFWDVQQFYYITHKIVTNGWETGTRKELETHTLDFVAKLESQGKIYSDKYAEDYLQQLIQKIHFTKIRKGSDQNLIVKIMNTDEKVWYAFDNGIILISTQFLAEAKEEKQVLKVLAEAIAHILLDSNIDNLDTDSESDLGQLGAIYASSTKKRMQIITNKYLNYYEKKAGAEAYSSEFDFLNAMAGIISYTAWQEYYNNHLQLALEYLDRLMVKNLANSADYLLKAKIYTKMVDTPGINQQAIGYLKTAATFKDQLLPEIYSDLGVLQLREKQYSDARNSFIEYQKMVSANKDDEKIKWALKMINLCDIYLKEAKTESSTQP